MNAQKTDKNTFSKWPILAVFLIVGLVIFIESVYTVDETEQVIVLQFGDPKKVIREPGLQFKIPFIQNLVVYDKRVLEVDPNPEEVLLEDQKRLVVDTFVRYRIVDPLLFYQTLKIEAAAVSRLSNQTNSALRANLGRVTMLDVLSEERATLMARIRSQINENVIRLGMEIVDVRIVRADLPEQTSQSIYARMRSEREREASEARAQGQEMAQQIRSRAERERTVLLAEAEREAQILRGQGDQEAIKIYADAFSVDPKFYHFYRSLEAYRKSMANKDTTLVLTPEGEFFRFFNDFKGR